MDFPSLEKMVTARTRGVVVVHPNNPTGSYVQAAEVEMLNSFCRERGLAVIADEVFLDYRLGNTAHASFAGNRGVRTFTLSGLSKIAALPQMKVAWVVTSGPQDEAAEAMGRLEVIADTYLSMNAPMQWATPVLLAQRKNVQPQLLERVKANLTELDRQLAAQKACQRLRVEGGWNALLRVPVTRSDEELAIELVREKSVLVHPGHFYDFPSEGYLVLSLITPRRRRAAASSSWRTSRTIPFATRASRSSRPRCATFRWWTNTMGRASASLPGRLWPNAPSSPRRIRCYQRSVAQALCLPGRDSSRPSFMRRPGRRHECRRGSLRGRATTASTWPHARGIEWTR